MNSIVLKIKKKDVSDLASAFREKQGQVQDYVTKVHRPTRGFKSVPKKGEEAKPKEICDYNSGDILAHYKKLCIGYDVKFYSTQANDIRYMANIKRVMQDFENEAILDMYLFLFSSGQTYIDIRKMSPAILLTRYINTIVADTQDWLDGKYSPNKPKVDREYTGDTNESKIGEWE